MSRDYGFGTDDPEKILEETVRTLKRQLADAESALRVFRFSNAGRVDLVDRSTSNHAPEIMGFTGGGVGCGN